MRRSQTIDAAYFDKLYTDNPDPWSFKTSSYEREKYQATLAAIGALHVGKALEIGCSIGVFTRLLAPRCESVVAVDGSDVALLEARRSCADLRNVTFERRMIPDEWPPGRFDLILISEVLYFLTEHDVEASADRCRQALGPGGEVIMCHWLGETDYPLSGQRAADVFLNRMAAPGFEQTTAVHDQFRLDRIAEVGHRRGG